jgi:hypothetical protein
MKTDSLYYIDLRIAINSDQMATIANGELGLTPFLKQFLGMNHEP